MEVTFRRNFCSCLNMALQEARSGEQTQEIRLPEGMPDVGKILSAWGQPILRSKEWQTDSVSCTGGMMVWVLYMPEDGSAEQCLEGWIPFQMRWDLPEDLPEGRMCLRLLPRPVDARSVSPRKILVRAGWSAMLQALVPTELPVFAPEGVPEGVELLHSAYPVRLRKEAGEKPFTLEETLNLPDTASQPEQIVYYRIEPNVTDRKVLTDKVVFRGNAGLHILYRGEEGQLHSRDFELPFSQYEDLSGAYSPEAQADFALCPTSAELDLDEEGQLHFKCGIAAQYCVSDREQLAVIEDAYSPMRELTAQMQTLELPGILETRKEKADAQQSVTGQTASVVDGVFLPDFPRQKYRDNGVTLELPGVFQSLYYDENGALAAASARWEGELHLNADENTRMTAVPIPKNPDAEGGGTLREELSLELTSDTRQQLPVVTGLTLGEERKPDPGRPSLILRRAGEDSLWEIAKASHSTVQSIRDANGLQSEPAPGQMLLIPVP